ncbi:MAG: hypothetical protein BAJALOKI3v1_160051 [Promethearchaeota archaeon]|nr:MAG: hypothetical protein BAJALOKI3v1_160051 [Candidatus Lokiarchaeota archaeon]
MDNNNSKTKEYSQETSEESLGDYLLKKEFKRNKALEKLLKEESKSKKSD